MIIQHLKGDVTSPKVGIIGHGVNCQGVMGSGVALTIRNKFPKAYQAYVEHVNNIDDKRDLLGTTQLVNISPGLYVANMFTQFNYGGDGAKYASIQAVRGACAHLEILRAQELKTLFAEEIQEISDFAANMFRPAAVGSTRERLLKTFVSAAVTNLLDTDETESPDTLHTLPIYLPLIGCGLGGLEWDIVQLSINSHTGNAPVVIYHYQK